MRSFDVAVCGGGPIGLGVAWRLAQAGRRVVVLDAGEPGAWQVAAGMLAPVAEADPAERGLLDLGLAAAERWPAFAAELAAASGRDPGLLRCGTLIVARDRDDAEALDRLLAFRRELGLPVERLLPSAARRLEPALAPTVRLALRVDGDDAVDPRALGAALAAAVRAAGGELRTDARVAAARRDRVQLAGGEEVHARDVVVAAGAHSGAIADGVPVRPVRGQLLRLRDRAGPGLVTRVVRTEHAYLVPRGDGDYVLGATMEDRGWDPDPTALAVFELLRDISEVVPGVLELALDAVLVGFRPGTPDNLPLIGRLGTDGPVVATGHHRNGILLTPITAELVAGLLDGAQPPLLAACDPNRFAARGSVEVAA